VPNVNFTRQSNQLNLLDDKRSAEMAQVNPNPHEHGYVFLPTNRVTGLFASYDDL
jgi:hypothetical protein